MVQEIMRDETFLSQKAEPATPEDLPAAQDLLDTLAAHKDACAFAWKITAETGDPASGIHILTSSRSFCATKILLYGS